MSKVSRAVERALELDVVGRHDDAIDQLAKASQEGDAEAMTQLAKRIIVGDRAPRLVQQGIAILNDAVQLGSAEAAERLAVIFASGIAGTPDWQAVLRLLVLAAERGWTPAYQQLSVLASMTSMEQDRPQQETAVDSAPRSPASYLRDIDLRTLLLPPEGSVVNSDPLIRHFPAFLNKRVCEWLIDWARSRLTRALVYDVASQSAVTDGSRTNSYAVFNNMETDLVHLMVQTRISLACGHPISHMETSTVLHYAVGEEFGNHYDFVDPEKPGYAEEVRRSGHRIITFLIYLNADYQGGETVFPKLGLSLRGQAGDGMYFVNALENMQADVRTLHNGQAPTSGEKWVFSQFIRDRRPALSC
ncbi:MAG TPA: 2OG-Fe(II) oxygenase [Hyphomicrobiales bacterium]|nr:2OG-Fe(II) oxygenase [Hyphomicrobiales bacterium]